MSSANDKQYNICNVLNGELIDVSNYVEMGYKTMYCSCENNVTCSLINPYPHKLEYKVNGRT